jgi:hypothetical protein
MPNETTVTATACAGTFGLEFGLLSKLTGDQRFIVRFLLSLFDF